MQVGSSNSVVNDGIDLHALAYTLWRQKIVILCAALLGTFVAATYAFLAEPLYEAKAFVIPPTQNDIENLNYGRIDQSKLPQFTEKEVYSVFLKNLQSESLRREFFKNTYLTAQGKSEDPTRQLYEKLSKNLVISIVGKETLDRYSVVMLHNDPEMGAKWIEQLLARAQQLAMQEINKNISSEYDIESQNLHQEIVSLREIGDKTREDSLIKLREALVVAQAIGLEKPPAVGGDSKTSLGIVGNMDGDLTYMRGTKALTAEIENLKARKSDDPFISRLRELETKYNFYNQLSKSYREAKAFRMDGLVEKSGSPVKPKFLFVILAGMFLGLVFGVVVAVVRDFFMTNKVAVQKSL
ncbi:UNVERIFIED_ORG: chain length determinant protein (polysaccharide antigen chain regulator) [Pseudomonas putida]|nr:chain length determinant protein (polysaccharide antigen chain regulator) [Pseudomonas putida]